MPLKKRSRKKVERGKMKVCIFGAGQGGQMAAISVADGIELLCYIDNNPVVQQKQINGYEVCSLETALRKKPDEIWITVLNNDAERTIEKQIIESGFKNKIRKISEIRQSVDVRLASLRLYAREIYRRNVKGAVAELGVYKGDFAKEMESVFPDRKIYLFDTFCGFPDGDIDTESERQFSCAKKGDFSDTSINYVINRFKKKQNVICKSGIFPDTAEGLEETYAFVNIDPDLYEPTLAGLTYFYPRLNKGGCIFVHDYNSFQFKGVRAAVTEYCKNNDLFVFPLTDMHGTAVIIKQ